MSIWGWAKKEAMMPITEGKWWGDVLSGNVPFNDLYQSHNAMHADATQELGNGWAQRHPDATAAAIFGAIAGGGALAGGAGSGSAGGGSVGAGGGFGLASSAPAGGSSFADYGVSSNGLGGMSSQFGGPFTGMDGVSQGGLFGLFNKLTPMQKAQLMQSGANGFGQASQHPQIDYAPVDTSMPNQPQLTPAQPAWSWKNVS